MYDHVWKSERQKAVEVQFRNLLKKGINFTLVGVVGAIFDYGTRFILLHFGVELWLRDTLTMLLVLTIRGLAIIYNWNLPNITLNRRH